jgi:hypothetical protein
MILAAIQHHTVSSHLRSRSASPSSGCRLRIKQGDPESQRTLARCSIGQRSNSLSWCKVNLLLPFACLLFPPCFYRIAQRPEDRADFALTGSRSQLFTRRAAHRTVTGLMRWPSSGYRLASRPFMLPRFSSLRPAGSPSSSSSTQPRLSY